ncbi:hypothetical protein SARC_10469 [Sphaeroforma arctica JP610]|uniref:Uncharacterized protein n=1 Tax=Sphaeroforma arctica JP610 TaxID=667725 RepID=A0A0L0FK00_9EUKA|nr:hypothetical protein SARC_10469 [Sphaeroforma arctica JP610]KNC77065.1 hypothetical protein SARC_10469 [Sphaeroforma arctica JP610]|eukprot:XP_014150967.1 hypothetical protein SARC_10469 [Sphaeroforma arctica JP610]
MTSNTTVDVLHPYPVGDLITIGEAATQFNGRGSLLKIKFLPVVNFAGNLVQLGDSLTYLSNTEEEGSGVLAPRTRAVNEFLEPVRDKIAELLVGPYIKYVTTVHQTEPGTWGPSANRKFFNLITSSSRNLQLTLSLEKYLNTSISGKSIGDPITSGTLNFQLEFDKIGLTRENIKFRFTKYISTLILKVLVLRATLANNYDAAFQLTESTTLNFSTLFELVSSPGMLGGLSDVSVFNGVYSATHEFAREASAIVWGERDDEVLRQERGRCVGSKTKRPNLYLPSSYFVPIPEDNVGQCVYIALAWQLLLQYVQRYSTKRINPDARHLIQLKTKDGEPYHDTVWSVLELLQPVRFPPLRMLETHIAPDNAGTPHSIHKEWCKPEIDFIVDWLVREFMPERPCWLKLEHVETLVERINVKMEVYKRSVNVFMISGAELHIPTVEGRTAKVQG